MEQVGKQCTYSNNKTQWANKNIYNNGELEKLKRNTGTKIYTVSQKNMPLYFFL